jgi:hypothetical protein
MHHLPPTPVTRHGIRVRHRLTARATSGAVVVAALVAALVTVLLAPAPAQAAHPTQGRDTAYGLSAPATSGPSSPAAQRWMSPIPKAPYAGPTERSGVVAGTNTSRAPRASAPEGLNAVVTTAGEHYLPTPYTAQPNGYTCGPTSVHMALALHNASPGIWALARELGTTTEGTGPTPIVVQALRNHTGAPYETATIPWNGGAIDPADTRRLWDNVVEDVDGGYAIVAYVYAPAHEYPYHDVAYPLEHYFVVDGYDTSYGTVRISDPANFSGRSRFWITVDQLAYLIAGTPGYAW